MSGPSERDEIATLGTFLAGLVDGAVDELAAELLASDWLADRDRRTAATAVREAADEQERLAHGPRALGSKSVAFKRLLFASWLRDRADRIESDQ